MLPGCAEDCLRVLVDAGIVVNRRCIFCLCLDESAADLDCVEFIGPNSAVEDFLVTFLVIKMPLTLLLDDGNREWPVIVTYHQSGACFILWVGGNNILCARLLGKGACIFLVLHRVRRGNEVFAIRTENLQQSRNVIVSRCLDQCLCCLLRGIK